MPICLALLCWIAAAPAFGQMRGHAHNDYVHPRPLLEAVQLGFASVEADVHAIGGRLLVAHDHPAPGAPALAALYLRPLDSLVRLHGGRVWAEDTTRLLLMIDFKTEAAATYAALKNELARFPALYCQPGACPVKIFISGSRPVEQLQNDGFPGLALDGRPDDLGKGFTAEQMPVVSDNYWRWCNWNGRSQPDAAQFDRIRELARRVHGEGRLLRLWAMPDHPAAWEKLAAAGVDLINTDRLAEFAAHARSR
jgi:hypothetical protein